MSSEYEIFYPGQYSEEDKKTVEEYKQRLDAVNNRGEIDLQALISGTIDPKTPGLGRRPFGAFECKDYLCQFDADNYEPDNPLYHDDDYARAAGFEKRLCIPLTADKGMFWAPMPAPLRDNLVVSNLNHVRYFHKPVYPGDTLYTITDRQDFVELTPEKGSDYRTFGISGSGRTFNQKGELVCSGSARTIESLRRHSNPKERNKTHVAVWECPAWWDLRPRHHYTKDDWDRIKSIWAKETVRGSQPLYWEDVNIGDEAPEFIEGPVSQLDQIKYHGLGEIGSPSMKKMFEDPVESNAFLVDEYGEYYPANGVGHLEDGRIPGHRPAFYNFMPVHYVMRALNNWIGDKGWIYGISWRIMNGMPGYEDDIPDFPDPESYIGKVPHLKGRTINTHGMTGDVILVKTYITGKCREGSKNYIDLVWWCEAIDGVIYQEGEAILELPSKG